MFPMLYIPLSPGHGLDYLEKSLSDSHSQRAPELELQADCSCLELALLQMNELQ